MKKIIVSIISFSLIFFYNFNNVKAENIGNYISLIQDSELENFITELMEPIYQVAGVDKKSINIYFVNNFTPNAFVYGGQNIFIHTGLFYFADNFEEIAGVLAHELGHITAGHLVRAEMAYANTSMIVTIGMGALLLASIASALAGNNLNGAELVTIFGGYSILNAQLNSSLAYSKSEEAHADQIAADYLKDTSYSLNGFYSFMAKLASKEDQEYLNNPLSWYTTHPLSTSRLLFIKNYINNHPQVISQENREKNKKLQQLFLNAKAKIVAYNNLQMAHNLYDKYNTNDALYAKAIIAYLQKNYQESIRLFNLLVQSDPNNLYFHEFLADIAVEEQNYPKAIAEYEILKTKDMDYINTFKLAKTFFAAKNYQQALDNINISLILNNNNAGAFFLKSLILGALNDIPRANLALAEYYLILQNYDKVKFFLNQVNGYFPENSIEDIDIKQIYNIINKESVY